MHKWILLILNVYRALRIQCLWTAARATPGRRRVIKVNSGDPAKSIFTIALCTIWMHPSYAVFLALKE